MYTTLEFIDIIMEPYIGQKRSLNDNRNEVCKNAAWQEITKSRVEAQRRFWAFFKMVTCIARSIIFFL